MKHEKRESKKEERREHTMGYEKPEYGDVKSRKERMHSLKRKGAIHKILSKFSSHGKKEYMGNEMREEEGKMKEGNGGKDKRGVIDLPFKK